MSLSASQIQLRSQLSAETQRDFSANSVQNAAVNGSIAVMEKLSPEDDHDWLVRSDYWDKKSQKVSKRNRRLRRNRNPLILCGHGASLQIEHGTLFVRNGFTHYPQKREEIRFFPGDPNLPTRILISNATGAISFNVLAWLSEQKIPLILVNWQGEPLVVANASYSANTKLVARQQEIAEMNSVPSEVRSLIIEKFYSSIETLALLPENTKTNDATAAVRQAIRDIKKADKLRNSDLLGIEGKAAAKYFAAWAGIPLKWNLVGRKFIPDDWKIVGNRRSEIGKSSRNARHPVNAMLNYAYSIAYAQVKIQLIADGYDPTIGYSHRKGKNRDALVLDFMEPKRPVADRVILKMILSETFSPGDFLITKEGRCRLNPQLARLVARRVMDTIVNR